MPVSKNEKSISSKNPPVMKDDLGVSSGVFSNVANISGSPREVLFDFGFSIPNEHVRLMSRIILTKEHAIEFKNVLVDFLKRYE